MPLSPHRILLAVLAGMILCGPCLAYERDKSDVVVLNNGDHVTGDILTLEYGILSVDTSDMGTVAVEWHAVRSVSSRFAFAVARNDGAKFFGPIDTRDGKLWVAGEGQAAQIPLADVERIARYSPSFWDRINGSLAVGFSYAKASGVSVGTVQFDSMYRSDRVEATLDASSTTSRDPNGGSTNRDLIDSRVIFLRQSRNFWALVGSIERDQEVGIDSRVIGGAVLGRRFQQTPASEVTGSVGLVDTEEWVTGGYQRQNSVESLLGAEWRIFRFEPLKTLLDLRLSVYPSLTESGRVREAVNLGLEHKIISDFTVGLSGFWSHDNRPPDPQAARSDYGVTFTLGYVFGD